MSERAPRPLTPDERALLDAFVSVDFPGAEALRTQAQCARVLRDVPITSSGRFQHDVLLFEVPHDAPKAAVAFENPVGANFRMSRGRMQAMLVTRDGYLRSVRVLDLTGQRPKRAPVLAELDRPFANAAVPADSP